MTLTSGGGPITRQLGNAGPSVGDAKAIAQCASKQCSVSAICLSSMSSSNSKLSNRATGVPHTLMHPSQQRCRSASMVCTSPHTVPSPATSLYAHLRSLLSAIRCGYPSSGRRSSQLLACFAPSASPLSPGTACHRLLCCSSLSLSWLSLRWWFAAVAVSRANRRCPLPQPPLLVLALGRQMGSTSLITPPTPLALAMARTAPMSAPLSLRSL